MEISKMKFSKADLKLLWSFASNKHPKKEMDYILVGRGGLYSCDTRRGVKLHCPDLQCCDFLTHKKVLKGFESVLGKNDIVEVKSGSDFCHLVSGVDSLNMDGTFNWEHKYPDVSKIFGIEHKNHFRLHNLLDIVFELSSRGCYIEDTKELITHKREGLSYDVFYTPKDGINLGGAKIVCTEVSDEEEVVLYTAVFVGRSFESQAS